MNVKRGERLHPIIVSLAHGAFRAETAGMKVSFTISAAASRLPEASRLNCDGLGCYC